MAKATSGNAYISKPKKEDLRQRRKQVRLRQVNYIKTI